MIYRGIVITGPRASGKSTIARGLSGIDEHFVHVQAITTRAKRDDDSVGEYEYLQTEEFLNLRNSNQLYIESNYAGNLYGIRKSDLDHSFSAGKIPVLTITPEAAADNYQVPREASINNSANAPEYLTIFLDAPDSILDERLNNRNQGHNQPLIDSDLKRRVEQRRLDRTYIDSFVYSMQNIYLEQSINLIIALWKHAGAGGILPARLIHLMLDCGMLLRNASPENVSGASYDLSLGDELFYGGKICRLTESSPIHMIEPYDYAIVTSHEKSHLPGDVCARFDLSVGLFCQGIILSNGPQIDPGFQGPLFALLFNTSSSPVLLKRGQHYATIEFHKLFEPTYGYLGHYRDKKLIDYLPANAAQGAINELKKELELVREESSRLQTSVMTILSLILAFIAIWITLK